VVQGDQHCLVYSVVVQEAVQGLGSERGQAGPEWAIEAQLVFEGETEREQRTQGGAGI
jgi:hypothetical protein